MTANELARSAAADCEPPAGLFLPAQAMWLAKAGQWDAAHDLCQNVPGKTGCWIHAHLHRQEGDAPNAAYWYARAGKPVPAPAVSLADEWVAIATSLESEIP